MKNLKVFVLAFSAVVMTACGSNSTRDFTTSNSGLNTGSNTSTGNIYNLPAAQENTATIGSTRTCPANVNCGSPTAIYTFGTSHTLRVKVQPVAAPNLLPPLEYIVMAYGCLKVDVTVNGATQTTQLLRVEGMNPGPNSPCKDAPTSQILDFSNYTTGSSQVTVTMSNAWYDHCYNAPYSSYGCPSAALFAGHLASAKLTVQTDGTWME